MILKYFYDMNQKIWLVYSHAKVYRGVLSKWGSFSHTHTSHLHTPHTHPHTHTQIFRHGFHFHHKILRLGLISQNFEKLKNQLFLRKKKIEMASDLQKFGKKEAKTAIFSLKKILR